MPRWQDLELGFKVARSITVEDGRSIFQLLDDLLPPFFPYRFGDTEPLRQKMEIPDIERLLAFWYDLFLWTGRRRGEVEGMILQDTHSKRHSSLWVSGRSIRVDPAKAVEFLLAVCAALHPDLAYIHLFTQHQLDTIPYDMYSPFRQGGVATPLLRRFLPDLCWGTVFGPPYVRFFDRKVLLSAPVYRAQEIDQDTIYVQLTERLTDLQTDYPTVAAIRDATKQHLNHEAFLRMELGEHYKYQTPAFIFAP